jgi:hypothetical protein
MSHPRSGWTDGLWALLLACGLAGCAAPPYVTVHPAEDPGAALHNPDMGWVLYENFPVDPRPHGSSNLITLPNDNAAGVDNVAVMFAWSDVETRPGRYDFSAVDRACDYWRRRGKRIQLRMSTESLLWWNAFDPPHGRGIPQDLLAQLPAAHKQTRTLSGIAYTVADARDPAYLGRLEKFLAAVESHFRGPRAVTLIDLRGFGVWGEWHSGFRYRTLADRRAALCGILDRFSTAFPDHFLALSYSHDPDGPPKYFAGPADHFDPAFTRDYDDFLRYSAFDDALSKSNVTFRRDGVGGAVFSNQRKLADQAFASRTRGPMVCEFIQGYADAKAQGSARLKAMIDDALSLHPNYLNLIGWQGADALAFVHEQPELFAYALRNMGYRLMPTSIRYPAKLKAGSSLRFDSTWENQAVGRAMGNLHLVLSLIGHADRTIASADAGPTGADRWIKGEPAAVNKHVSFDRIPAGHYELAIALQDPVSAQRIDLPLARGREDGSCPIGPIEIEAP